MPDEATDRTFSKSDRILKRQTFRRVYDSGKKVRARFFTAFILPNSQDHSRLGITATRKTGNSVERNRSRRRVRELYRRNKWRVPSGVDIVINVKDNLARAEYDELARDFAVLWERGR